jgi:nudix-type nucleoside diphosphatase (YffH/AdpP family)
MVRRIKVSGPTRKFDGFFKIDEYEVSLEDNNGQMGAPQRRLVFERGDSVAVLLFNRECWNVVLVKQFKAPAMVGRRRDDEGTTNGWIVETVAGMIDGNETPEQAVVRETMEETGYQIANPKLISTFFSSPGGTSERIFLYFAEVRNADKTGPGGGDEGEQIDGVSIAPEQLFARLKDGTIEDPKLIVAAYWLQNHLKSGKPLNLDTKKYCLRGRPDRIVGYKTGSIERIEDVSLWVNSENQDMLMDRFIGKTVSAHIRRLGSNRKADGTVIEDTIHDSLRAAVGQRHRVEIGTVLDTVSGALRKNGVHRVLHVATVKAKDDGGGVQADRDDLVRCVKQVLNKAEERNQRPWNIWWWRVEHRSILIPMLGAGDGGLPVEDVAETIIPVAETFLRDNPKSVLKEIYFLAYTSRDKAACDRELEGLQRRGALELVVEH